MTSPIVTIGRFLRLNTTAQEIMGSNIDFEYLGDSKWIIRKGGKMDVDFKGQVIGSGLTPWLVKATTGATLFILSKVNIRTYEMTPK